MKRESRMLHRLKLETMDWCRSMQTSSELPLRAYEYSIQHRPEVWHDPE
jgi:hypothetical protein